MAWADDGRGEQGREGNRPRDAAEALVGRAKPVQATEFKSWSKTEKKAARKAFDLALEREFADIRAKAREMLDTPDAPRIIWKVRRYLNERAEFVDRVYDYRYSVLGDVFALLVGRGTLAPQELEGLAPEKIARIVKMSELYSDRNSGDADSEEKGEGSDDE